MKRFLLTALFTLLIGATAWSQTDRVVTGKVTSAADGTGLPGVNVLVEGTSKGTTTDANGSYSISLGATENVLVFSFIGYQAATVQVGDRTVADVAMAEDITSLEEVVVVGYGTQREKDLTSSIAT